MRELKVIEVENVSGGFIMSAIGGSIGELIGRTADLSLGGPTSTTKFADSFKQVGTGIGHVIGFRPLKGMNEIMGGVASAMGDFMRAVVALAGSVPASR